MRIRRKAPRGGKNGDSGRGETFGSQGLAVDLLEALKRELDRPGRPLEDVQATVDRIVRRSNEAPRESFQGLSSDQMHAFMTRPFDSPDWVTFASPAAGLTDNPALSHFLYLADAIGEKGLKATVKGNLPRQFCRDAAQTFWKQEPEATFLANRSIQRETDFFQMHVVRLTAQLAGLIRKYHGRFLLVRRCVKMLAEDDLGGIYMRLFRAYVQKFNWAYRDQYLNLFIVQRCFLFTLYLLHRFGEVWRPASFYQDLFLAAFPKTVDEVPDWPYLSSEQRVRNCYTWRSLGGFASFLGLAEMKATSDSTVFDRKYLVKKSDLLEEFVQFHIP